MNITEDPQDGGGDTVQQRNGEDGPDKTEACVETARVVAAGDFSFFKGRNKGLE